MKQPANSTIVFLQYPSQLKFELPSAGWSKDTFFWLLMSISWIGVFVLLIQQATPIVFLVPIGLMALISPFVFLFFTMGKREITVDQDYITVSWSLFGQGRTRKRSRRGLEEVKEVLMYKRNRRRIYGIGLFFKQEKKVKFGSNLSEEDRNWLMNVFSELREKS